MDPFWDDSAISLLTAECAAFLALGKDCFADVVRFQSSMGIYSAGNAGITTSFDKVMEEAAASRPEYCDRKILEYIPGESGSDCPLHLYIIKHCDG